MPILSLPHEYSHGSIFPFSFHANILRHWEVDRKQSEPDFPGANLPQKWFLSVMWFVVDAYSGDILGAVISLYSLTMCFLLWFPWRLIWMEVILQDAFLSLFSLHCDGANYLLPSEQLLFNRFQRGTYLATSNEPFRQTYFSDGFVVVTQFWLCFSDNVTFRLRGFQRIYLSVCLWKCMKTSSQTWHSSAYSNKE